MKKILIISIALLYIACGGSNSDKNEEDSTPKVVQTDAFNLPNINGVDSPTKDISFLK